MSKKNNCLVALSIIIATFFILTRGFCAEPKHEAQAAPASNGVPVYAGEFLDTKVPMQNYIFMQNAVTVFSNKMGPAPKTAKEREDYVWDILLLSYESFRRNVVVPQEEIDREISNITAGYKIDFDWKTNKAAFEKWVREKTGEPAELFGNQIRQLLQIEKLRQQITESMQPRVSEKEAHRAFLDEYNALDIELAQFDTQKEAEDFYYKLKGNPGFWDDQKKKDPGVFRKPGFVSLAFLMDIWRFPRDAAYKMMKMKEGEFYPPAPIYKGYAVFRILKSRPAGEADFAKVKNTYLDKVKTRKKYEAYNEWFKNFKEQAKVKIYPIAELHEKEGGQKK